MPIVTVQQSPRELEPTSPDAVQVFIDEVDHENWAKGGTLAVDRDR